MKVITVGRGSENNLVIDEPQASLRHFQIVQGDDRTLLLTDLNSENGTWVNGKRVTAPVCK